MDTFSDTELDAAGIIIGALDSHLRVRIIWRLSVQEHFVHELVDALGKSQPLISQHLRVLKESGIVDSERKGREVVYRLVRPETARIVAEAVNIGRLAGLLPADSEAPVADVIPLGTVAHTPAAVTDPAAGQDTSATIPDPAPLPPTPHSFT